MYLIGIAGKARTGKDTIAEHLVSNHKYHQYAFAAPIKVACKAMFGWNEQHTDGDLKEVVDPDFGISPRAAMQKLGTEFGREMVNPNMWTTRANKEFDRLLHNEFMKGYFNGMVVSDVRFENEADWVRERGGTIIHVTRSKAIAVREHKSEQGIAPKDGDVIITNDNTLDDLYWQVDKLADALAKMQRDNTWK